MGGASPTVSTATEASVPLPHVVLIIIIIDFTIIIIIIYSHEGCVDDSRLSLYLTELTDLETGHWSGCPAPCPSLPIPLHPTPPTRIDTVWSYGASSLHLLLLLVLNSTSTLRGITTFFPPPVFVKSEETRDRGSGGSRADKSGVERWGRWSSDLPAECVCQDAPLDIILANHS